MPIYLFAFLLDGGDRGQLKSQLLKRFMARAKGRGTQIFKRTSHISVVVGSAKSGKSGKKG